MMVDLGQSEQAIDQIVDKAERTRLLSISDDREWLPVDGLMDECRNDAPIIPSHSRPIGIEDPGNAGINLVSPPPCMGGYLGESLGFVVTAANGVERHVARIRLALRVLGGVTIDFAGAGEDEPGIIPASQLQRMTRSICICGQYLQLLALKVSRAGGGGQVEDQVHLADVAKTVADIVLEKGEAGVPSEMAEIRHATRTQVVYRMDGVAFPEQAVCEV